MSNYTKATDFAAKDALTTGDPAKIVKGTEIDDEFNAISTAVNSKANTSSPTLTGTPLAPTATAGANTTQIATTAFVSTAVTNERTASATLTNKTLTSPTINTATISGGSVSGITDLAIADGGTGASTAADARTNLGLGSSSSVTFSSLTSSLTGNVTGNVTGNLTGNVTGTVTGTLNTGTWSVSESGGVLYFAVSGVNKAKLDSSGNLTVVGDITAFGSV